MRQASYAPKHHVKPNACFIRVHVPEVHHEEVAALSVGNCARNYGLAKTTATYKYGGTETLESVDHVRLEIGPGDHRRRCGKRGAVHKPDRFFGGK